MNLQFEWGRSSFDRLLYNTPVIADIDNDGTNDVLFGTRDGVLYVVHYSGSSTCALKWKKDLGDT